MRTVTRSLKLIDKKVREDKEANRLFLEILTSKNDAETVLRRHERSGCSAPSCIRSAASWR